MDRTLDVDHLVVGAGAMGMAFADALVQHSGARVALVDRRHGVGGHWLEAYPFVRLHQASCFYGVASTLLGGGRLQESGPEAGLQIRASQPEIVAYFAQVAQRLQDSGRVEVLTSSDVVGRTVVSRVSSAVREVPASTRIVDARYLAPDIPAETPPPFAVGEGVRVVPVNDLVRLEEAPRQYVVVGSGKTATDACVWLLGEGVDPDAICWVRPRDPWMLNRALIQPDPEVYLGVPVAILEAAAASADLDEVFLRLEDAGVMLRIDRTVTPRMAKAPTLGEWELGLLRTIEDVVRHGHLAAVERGRLRFADGTTVGISDDAVVVHCAADALKNPPLVPVWGPGTITLQPVRAGFPCFGAALTGYVEATRVDDDEKNRLCPPSRYGNSLAQWAEMNLRGTRAAQAFGAEPDIASWASGVALNPARIPPDHPGSPAL
ncbi:NAD(P)-binding protein, partial [Nocardioides zeicaulis]